jgi:histidyl-tRNA synthetase
VALKTALVATGLRVRLEKRTKNLKALLERAGAAGYGRFALVADDTVDAGALEFKAL